MNSVHFFNAASMIYGTCTQFCTEQTCPTMAAGKASVEETASDTGPRGHAIGGRHGCSHAVVAPNRHSFPSPTLTLSARCVDVAMRLRSACVCGSEYLWKDGVNYKKPTRVPAPVYIDLLLSWICVKIEDPVLFPVEQSQSHDCARGRG